MKISTPQSPAAVADICLLLEGTYPYVRGGVSTWVKQIIEGMPELKFSIVFLGAHDGEYDEMAYALPENVVHLEMHYLLQDKNSKQDKVQKPRLWQRYGNAGQRFNQNSELHRELTETDGVLDASIGQRFAHLLSGPDALTEHELSHGKQSWQTIKDKYANGPAGMDFNHYFWSVKSMHSPLFTLAKIASNAPAASVYHAVSTGYAGFLGSLIASNTGLPFIITEHGIYTKERELDLAQVDWIPEELDPFKVGLSDDMNYLRSLWIRFFRSLGRMSYASANQVLTLYNGNRLRQIADGAEESLISIVPNGVDVPRFSAVRRAAHADIPPVLALIGRVVPIKDIKNFIRAMRIISAKIPGAQGWIVGPTDEDPDYTQECMMLVDSQGLGDAVRFLGFQRPEDIFPKVGLSVLTSVSEGQPLVVLESFAAGIPAVTTDVGSCSELIHGGSDDDKALGCAGAVVPIANPAEFAEQVIDLIGNPDAWHRASVAAIQRVEQFYDERDMLHRYRTIYNEQAALVRSEKKAS